MEKYGNQVMLGKEGRKKESQIIKEKEIELQRKKYRRN